jgi:steroid delta-isomerase-like uncharacterized protein
MNTSENLMRQYQDAMNNHDIDKVRQLFHPQYSHTAPDGTRQQGIDAGIQTATMYRIAFPDLKINVKSIYSIENVAISEFVAEGTQRGKIMDLEPTNRRISVPVCDVIEVRDNKIYSEHEYFDTQNMMEQLQAQKRQAAQM